MSPAREQKGRTRSRDRRPGDSDRPPSGAASGDSLATTPAASPFLAPGPIALALGFLWLGLCVACWPYTMDDAFISLRYATHLAAGQGLTWNLGGPPVEGFSNPLWVLWMAAASAGSADPMALTKGLGALLGFVAIGLLLREGRDMLPGMWGSFPALCLAASPMFAFWSVSGIETPGAVAALLAGWRGVRLGRIVLAGAGFGALALLRPEGTALAVLALGAAVVASRGAALRQALGAAGLAGAIVAPYLIWRLVRFGSPVANTVAAKWMPLGGLRYFLGDLAILDGAHLLLAAVAVAALLAGARMPEPATPGVVQRTGSAGPNGVRGLGTRRSLLLGAGLTVAQALALLNTRPAMGFYLRLFWPVLPLVLLLSATALVWLATRVPPGWVVAAPAAVLALFPLLRDVSPIRLPTAPASAPVIKTARAVGEILRTVHRPLADWVRTEHPGATVALTDCGLLPWRSEAAIIDLWGLNDTEIARDGFDADRVLARRPDLLVLASRSAMEFKARFPMDAALQAHPSVASGYRLVNRYTWTNTVDGSGDYSLWVYERNP